MADENESSTNIHVWLQKYGWHLCKVWTKIPPGFFRKNGPDKRIYEQPGNKITVFWRRMTSAASSLATLSMLMLLGDSRELEICPPNRNCECLKVLHPLTAQVRHPMQGGPTRAFYKLWEETILLFVLIHTTQTQSLWFERGETVRRGRFILWEGEMFWHLSLQCKVPVLTTKTAPLKRPCRTYRES